MGAPGKRTGTGRAYEKNICIWKKTGEQAEDRRAHVYVCRSMYMYMWAGERACICMYVDDICGRAGICEKEKEHMYEQAEKEKEYGICIYMEKGEHICMYMSRRICM